LSSIVADAMLRRMILRRALPDDRPAISAVHAAAFAHADGGDVAEAGLVDELYDDGSVLPELSIVAMGDDDVVGHVVCSRASVKGQPAVGLGPIGVPPDYQRRRVGQALMHGVLAAADALNEQAVVLLGDPVFYRRFGFVLATTVGLLPPDPAWAEHFQVRLLGAWDGSLRGTFRYAPAFDHV
jgi:putative acetyltransferase